QARGTGVSSSIVSFFFSSRRRHTRCYRDWSSDVCSSDLRTIPVTFRSPDANLGGERKVTGIVRRAAGELAGARRRGAGAIQLQRSEERRVGKEATSRMAASTYEEGTSGGLGWPSMRESMM